MALKDMIKSLVGKKETEVQDIKTKEEKEFLTGADFPVIPASNVDLNKYRKVPLMGLAALGSAFSMLPEAARTITETVTTYVDVGTPVFTGLWPEGVAGRMIDKGLGFSGNILAPDSTKFAGRMRFKLMDKGLPVSTTSSTVVPFDPMTMVIAATLISIDKKLDTLQEKTEEILQFLKLEKQTRQRGNLNMLAEIMEEYKADCGNEKMCALRVVAVQDIKREAQQDILFYQEQIARKLKEQKIIYGAQQSNSMMDAVMNEFYEYQLASYLYAYTSFMEVMLQKNFNAASTVAEKMTVMAEKYTQLYNDCKSQINNYQRSSVENQLLGGLGNAAKVVGEKLAAVPVLGKGQFDEALISAGESLEKFSNNNVAKRLETFAPLEDSHMEIFISNVRQLDLLFNCSDSMLTDGENLYILEAA